LWQELAPELVRNHLLAPRYLQHFEMLVFSIIEFRKSADLLRITGPVTRGRGDVLVTSPASRETARWIGNALRLGQEFGMTPSAVTAIAREQDQPLDRADPSRLLS
jgi:phage terminase small subunit